MKRKFLWVAFTLELYVFPPPPAIYIDIWNTLAISNQSSDQLNLWRKIVNLIFSICSYLFLLFRFLFFIISSKKWLTEP